MLDQREKGILNAATSLVKFVCPLYRSPNQTDFEYAGSSTLLKVGEFYFIVTAAHVVERPGVFYVPPGIPDENMVPFKSNWRYCRAYSKTSKKDRVDVRF
jgi:hypothetical protein